MRARAGDHIKVSRFGESLWLAVLRVYPGETYLGTLANVSIAWVGVDPVGLVEHGLGYGTPVIVGGAEILEIIDNQPKLRLVVT